MNLIYHTTNFLSTYFLKILLYSPFYLFVRYIFLYFLTISAFLELHFFFIFISTILRLGAQIPSAYTVPQLSKAADDFCSIEKENLQVSVAKHNTRRYIEMHNYYINILSHLKGIYL